MPTSVPAPVVTGLYRYPVKGLTPHPLTTVDVAPGKGLPFDRVYAVENGGGRFDPQAPQHLPKIAFLMLMRDERLATLDARFDTDSHLLTIKRAGKEVARGDLRTRIGCSMIEQFLAAYMAPSLRGAAKIVTAPDHMFSDVATKCLHIVNLATVRAVESVVGKTINPLRFRANVYIDGIEPWAELAWLNRDIRIGEQVQAKVFKRTQRCDATNVDPATGIRDFALPAIIRRTWGHSDLGVYATVETGGRLMTGDRLVVPS